MNVSGEYKKILEDNLKKELEWLEQEFEMLFRQKRLKKSYTPDDIAIGNQILDNVIENLQYNNNTETLNMLALTLNKIEQIYPEFF
ncbi:MAG: hypothetical protein ACXADU_02105 [Promethearchaeota archaeon]|jgi:hypothetical protein